MATMEHCKKRQESISYTCAGPFSIKIEQQKKALAKLGGMLDVEDIEGMCELLSGLNNVVGTFLPRNENTVGGKNVLIPDPKNDGKYVVNPSLSLGQLMDCGMKIIRNRVVCGADVSSMIRELPFDGGTYTIVCENCGTSAEVTRPCADEMKQSAQVKDTTVDIEDLIK